MLARDRDAAELAHHKAAQGLIAQPIFVGKIIEVEQFLEIIHLHEAVQQPGAILAANGLRLGGIASLGDGAHNGFENII